MWMASPTRPFDPCAARIDLVNISTRFAGTPFAGREVRIDAVGIYNMKTKSYYFSEADWGETELPMPCEIREDTSFEDLLVNDGASISNTPFVHYVMENMKSDDRTMIAVKATLQGIPVIKTIRKSSRR